MADANVGGEAGSQAAHLGDAVDDPAGPVDALGVQRAQQRRHLGVGVGCDDEHQVQRGHPLADGRVHGDPRFENFSRVVRPHEALHHRAVGDGDWLVVAGQRPVEGQLQDVRLAADRREDRSAAHAGAFGDHVDGGRHVAPLHEQVGAGVDDTTPGDP